MCGISSLWKQFLIFLPLFCRFLLLFLGLPLAASLLLPNDPTPAPGPFSLMTYMVEGGASPQKTAVRTWIYKVTEGGQLGREGENANRDGVKCTVGGAGLHGILKSLEPSSH